MTAVDKSSVSTSPAETVFSIINDRNFIKDPRSATNRNTRKFVYDVDPFALNIDFSEYPLIYVEDALLLKGKQSANYRTKEYVWTQRIVVRAVKDGSGQNRTDVGIRDVRKICDDLSCTFDSQEARNAMKDGGLSLIELRQLQSPTPVTIENQVIIEAAFELSYRTRMRAY